MRLDLSLSQRPELQLKLSPQLIQRIEILQLPAQELLELIQNEVAENETLEVEAPRADQPTNTTSEGSGAAEKDLDEQVSDQLETYTRYNEVLKPRVRKDDGEADPKLAAMANAPDAPPTLADHLREQLAFASLPPHVHDFVEILIDQLDENGFLAVPLEDVRIPYDDTISRADAEHALEFLKSLDPIGVGARDMRECFLMQLDPDHENFDLHRRLIADHLDDWRDNKLPRIMRALGVDLDTLKEVMEELRHILKPPPGRLFRADVVVPVRPDVVVKKNDGRYEVELADDYYPHLSVSSSYVDAVRDRGLDSSYRRDIKGKLDRARFLIEAIEQRRNTLRRVATEIVKHQREFFDNDRLMPLKMRDVADELGLHVSTVSRAISDKWMQTHKGIFPMKHFFTGAAPGGEAEGLESRDSVRIKVREIIDGEDKSNPLSDEDIVDKLKSLGLDIARRTVTKYRKMMNIPSSRERREY